MRSPWLIVTVLLAIARPLCTRSTAISTGWSGDAARANTMCSVLTVLASWPMPRGRDRLRHELPAEDDEVAGVDVVGAVAVGAELLEREDVEHPVDGERHGYLGGKRSAPSSRMFSPLR